MTTIVRGKYVLTSSLLGALHDGAVAFEDDKIVAVSSWTDVRRQYPDARVVGDGYGIVIPGLVNCHDHFSEGLLNGIGEGMSLLEWVERIVRPVAPHLTREMARVGTTLKAVEMLSSGVTTVNDMFMCLPGRGQAVSPGVVEGLESVGLRGQVAFGAQDTWSKPSLGEIFGEHEALAAAAARSDRIRFRLGIATILIQSPELLAESVSYAQRERVAIHIHFHEVREEVTASRIAHARSAIEYAASVGLFDVPVLGAHCVWLSASDITLLARHGVSVAHNPVSNMILASGVCPVARLRREGIAVGLGTDGAASNDSQDMLQVLKIAALLQKVVSLDPSGLNARDILDMATIEGARALGVGDQIGSLEPGKQADLVLLSGNSPTLANIHDPYQSIIYCAGPRDVTEVWVAGDAVYRNGGPVYVDTDALYAAAREQAAFLVKKADLTLSALA